MQRPLFKPQTEWVHPNTFPDLSDHDEISIDLETKDPNLIKMGPGTFRKDGEVVGIAVAVSNWSGYYPIAHEGGGNMDRKRKFSNGSPMFLKQILLKYFTMPCMMFVGFKV